MSRIPLAVASLSAMAASFAAAFLLVQGRRDDALPPFLPVVQKAPAVSGPSAPGRAPAFEGAARAPAPAPPAPDASLRELAAAADAREEASRRAVFGLPEDASLGGKLDHYRRSLREAFADAPGVDLERQRGVFTEVFLRNPSVQAELASLDPGARERALEHIRRQMGYPDEEIARLEEIDAQRESRWQNGLAYMEERRRLAATFEGEVLEEELRHLRERYFGHEAVTIEREEAGGFFRYERPRVYGRN